MLTAQKSEWFESVFAVYNRNLIKRRFYSFKVCNLDELQKRGKHFPLIIYANHSSWWDGLAAFEISRTAKLQSYIMMEERHLKKLSLFRRLGAFSVNRENPRESVKSIKYAAEILKENSGRALWIFPQGEILPNDSRPIHFYNGLSRIIEKVGSIQIVPVAMRYEFLDKFKPEIFIKVGRLQSIEAGKDFESKKMTARFAGKLTEILDELKNEVARKDFDNFEGII